MTDIEESNREDQHDHRLLCPQLSSVNMQPSFSIVRPTNQTLICLLCPSAVRSVWHDEDCVCAVNVSVMWLREKSPASSSVGPTASTSTQTLSGATILRIANRLAASRLSASSTSSGGLENLQEAFKSSFSGRFLSKTKFFFINWLKFLQTSMCWWWWDWASLLTVSSLAGKKTKGARNYQAAG